MLGSGGIEHPAAALRSAQSRSRPVRRQQRQRSRAGSLPNVDRRIRRKICPGAVRTFRHKVAAQYFSDRSVRKSLCRPGPDGSDGRESGIYASRLRSAAPVGRPAEKPGGNPARIDPPERIYELAESPENADFAIVFIDEPDGGCGYDAADREKGGNGYVPISLQYGDYTARHARPESIAGGDPKEPSIDRSYRGKTVRSSNREELKRVLGTKRQMGDKPVVAVVSTTRPFVPAEFEPSADAILLAFGVQRQAVLDIISGRREPSALLPMQLPADMKTVEQQHEDVPRDMVCYTD